MDLAGLIIGVLVLVGVIALLWRQSRRDDSSPLLDQLHRLEQWNRSFETGVRDDLAGNRQELAEQQNQQRSEILNSLRQQQELLHSDFTRHFNQQKEQLDSFSRQLISLTEMNDRRLEGIRQAVEKKLTEIQSSNSDKLEEMRRTVDEKLQSTLEKRLGESFNIVSDRLEKVHAGLGEMQQLATGVGDLKRVLTNVKSRGVWGEIQLEALLENIMTPEQYSHNVQVKPGSREQVEFAIRLPGKNSDDQAVWLPIDSKFPREDYERLLDAQETGDLEAVSVHGKALVTRIRQEARQITQKYVIPPHTTDFAIMFLPIEGLYAEVMRTPGLLDSLQREHRIIVAGPSTLSAFLNSLQMGFRTLAIEKRSSEVWELLGVVKSEFGKFGDLLDKTKTKLQQASNSIEDATRKTRTIERKLRNVQVLPSQSEEPPGIDSESAAVTDDSQPQV